MSWTTIGVRYIKQYNNYSCGPTAILNALKWAGYPATYTYHYPQVAKDCRVRDREDDYGTYNHDLDRVLRTYGDGHLVIHKPRTCSYNQFRKHMKAGGAAILCYFAETEGHFTFIAEYNPESKRYLLINDELGTTHTERTARELQMRFRHFSNGNDFYPQIWLLSRKQETNERPEPIPQAENSP